MGYACQGGAPGGLAACVLSFLARAGDGVPDASPVWCGVSIGHAIAAFLAFSFGVFSVCNDCPQTLDNGQGLTLYSSIMGKCAGVLSRGAGNLV